MSSVGSEDRMNNTFRRLAAFSIVAAMQGCLVGLALAHTLLVCFVFRIILFVVLKWSRHGLNRDSTEASTYC